MESDGERGRDHNFITQYTHPSYFNKKNTELCHCISILYLSFYLKFNLITMYGHPKFEPSNKIFSSLFTYNKQRNYIEFYNLSRFRYNNNNE